MGEKDENNIKFLLFDCMETIIDMTEIPDIWELFTFKVISVNRGWRKPSINFYNEAKEKTGLN